MPRDLVVTEATVTEGVDAVLTARIITADGTQLVQGDITGNIELRVYDVTSGSGKGRDPNTSIFTKTDIAKDTGGPEGAACVSNAYATTYWDGKDGTGYNFAYQIEWDLSGSAGPYLRGGHKYRLEFFADGGSIGDLRWVFILNVRTGKTA